MKMRIFGVMQSLAGAIIIQMMEPVRTGVTPSVSIRKHTPAKLYPGPKLIPGSMEAQLH
jgi:hypothetical protein